MHTRKLHIPLTLGLGLMTLVGVLAMLWTMGDASHAVQTRSAARSTIAATSSITRYVSSVSGSDASDCTDETAPCQSIQYAVDQADDGDEIRIATMDNAERAIYTDTGESIVALTKSLTLRGGYLYVHPLNKWTRGPLPSSVDGEGERRAIHISGDVTVTLRMLSLVNGQADYGGNIYAKDAGLRFVATPIMSGTADYGGGLYLQNCRTSFDPGDLSLDLGDGLGDGLLDQLDVSNLLLIQNNAAQYGGGIYIEGGMPILAGLAVRSNTATADGGGVYAAGGGPIFAGGLILENQAGERGGGLFLEDSAARIAASAIYSNTAGDGAGFYLDGPLAFTELTVPIIANNYVRYNRTTSSQGGGFYFRRAIAGLVNNVIADNEADDGAALYLWASSPQLFQNTIAQNSGDSGIYLTDEPGQAWPPVAPIPSLPTFTNTIVASQTLGFYVDSSGLPAPLENQITLKSTLWWGNGSDAEGPGLVVRKDDIEGNPRFKCTGKLPDCVLPYHLAEEGSAAVDAGVVPALSIPGTDLLVDIDMQLRPSNQIYDIGADEVVTRAFDTWFMPPLSTLSAEPGQTVTHAHQLMNTGLQTDTYELSFHSGSGWATLVSASSITLTEKASATVQVRVSVPETVTRNMRDTSAITATSQGALERKGHAMDVTNVFTGGTADLSLGKWADADVVSPGEAVRFTLVITNAGPLTDTFAVTLTDKMIPTQAIAEIDAPHGDCWSDVPRGMVTCTLTLEGAPITQALDIVITSSETYTGLLVNTAGIRSSARDLKASNNLAEATISLSSANIPPVAADDHYTTAENVTLSVAVAEGLLSNDFDPDGSEASTLTATLTHPPSGTLNLAPDGSFIYTPTLDFNGTVTFTYRADDGSDLSDPATATISVGGTQLVYLPLVMRSP